MFNLTRKQLILRLRKVPNEDDVKFVISFPWLLGHQFILFTVERYLEQCLGDQ